MSLPTWGRGLKSVLNHYDNRNNQVAPYMGAWIEIVQGSTSTTACRVAPYMGAWIEMIFQPSPQPSACVAPYMGAWIEMLCIA